MKTPLVHLCSSIVLTGLFTTSLLMGKDKESAEKMDPKVAEMMKNPKHSALRALPTGYDNHQKQYNTLWVDDMSTAILKSEGSIDSDGKVITFPSKMDCPMTGEKDMPIKQVIRIVNADTHVFEMHETRAGKEERKTMEITYTRSK